MTAYAKLFRSIWQDEDFRVLTSSAQRTYLLLVSQPDISHCGVLPLTPGRWGLMASDTDAKSVRADIVSLTLPETLGLTVSPFVLVDALTEELLVRSYAKHDGGYKVPNIRTALVRSIEEVMSVPLRLAALTLLQTLGVTLSETLWPSQHQHQHLLRANGSQQQQPHEAPIPSPNRSANGSPAAAAERAVDIILSIRRAQAGASIKNPERWATKTRPLLEAEYGARLLAHHGQCTGPCDPRDLVALCGFGLADIARATA